MDDEPGLSVRVLRNLEFADLGEIALILAFSVAVIVAAERAAPPLVRRAGVRVERALLPLLPLVRLAVTLIALTLVLRVVVEPTLQNLVTIAGALAVAIGFALKDYLSSLFAGIVAVLERPYRPGDWISIDGAYGVVRDHGFRAVQIVTLDDTVVTIPHGKLWEGSVRNASDGAHTLQCIADFYLAPEHDAAAVRDRLRDVALTSAYLYLDRPVLVVAHERPWGTHYRLKAYPYAASEQVRFTTDLTVRGKEELIGMGCRFAVLPAGALDAAGEGADGSSQVGRGASGG